MIPVWKQNDCVGAYPENLVTDSMMCAGNKAGGKDSCQVNLIHFAKIK